MTVRLYSYVVARDFGFAPNPFYGTCTLATCKPTIRRCALIGDWIVGTGPKSKGRGGHLVYAMKVDETLSFDEYWLDPRFQRKRPSRDGSYKQAFGDNIYHQTADRTWSQSDSHHSYDDGSINPRNVRNDTQTPRVLLSKTYGYWGGSGPAIPREFRDPPDLDICAGRGHHVNFSKERVEGFISWLHSVGLRGYVSEPMEWGIR